MTVLVGPFKVAKNFSVYLPQFGDSNSEISDQNFKKFGENPGHLK